MSATYTSIKHNMPNRICFEANHYFLTISEKYPFITHPNLNIGTFYFTKPFQCSEQFNKTEQYSVRQRLHHASIIATLHPLQQLAPPPNQKTIAHSRHLLATKFAKKLNKEK